VNDGIHGFHGICGIHRDGNLYGIHGFQRHPIPETHKKLEITAIIFEITQIFPTLFLYIRSEELKR